MVEAEASRGRRSRGVAGEEEDKSAAAGRERVKPQHAAAGCNRLQRGGAGRAGGGGGARQGTKILSRHHGRVSAESPMFPFLINPENEMSSALLRPSMMNEVPGTLR